MMLPHVYLLAGSLFSPATAGCSSVYYQPLLAQTTHRSLKPAG
jgi:hypothetical protein